MHNKVPALVALGKYLGMFDERPQNTNVIYAISDEPMSAEWKIDCCRTSVQHYTEDGCQGLSASARKVWLVCAIAPPNPFHRPVKLDGVVLACKQINAKFLRERDHV
jgi:hypothetical protein